MRVSFGLPLHRASFGLVGVIVSLYGCVVPAPEGVFPATGLGPAAWNHQGSLAQIKAESKGALSISLCNGNPCGPHGNCIPNASSYTYSCSCEGGYVEVTTGNKATCQRKDACDTSPCGTKDAVKECRPNGQYYACICQTGYQSVTTNAGPRCQRIKSTTTPCSSNPCGGTEAVAACLVTGATTYSCTCQPGYEPVTTDQGETCQKTDPCVSNPCGSSKYVLSCTATDAGYTCECAQGAQKTGSESAPTCVASDTDMTQWYVIGGIGGCLCLFAVVYLVKSKPSPNPNDPLYAHDFEGMY
ncbi:unnamed protein product [Neospora caninum Liverpool]|uniref:Microneme protein MIC9 n=1 Tax=Neospora caninum (strain Liverpool) TaxID=572307 RepID=F0VQ53_NEOCL|nr:uncharacterized protein NCLIV_062760 [Neospora caninum Liverpool]CBZ55850.1 unnamed protein product [Neospora caninum Liverpool]CEL70594.1 TPA: microneme protein MIC9 [Neospora caninum Liverpool]|eukprot:XP_003885876.1 uncharacterized protein NCLIV_062760 [Neospora caninum Liverpool]